AFEQNVSDFVRGSHYVKTVHVRNMSLYPRLRRGGGARLTAVVTRTARVPTFRQLAQRTGGQSAVCTETRRARKRQAPVPKKPGTNVSSSKFELELREDEARKVPGLGDDGIPVHLDGEEQKLAEDLMKKEAFNILLSDKIPYNRRLPDARNPKCKDVKYDADLPSASVVIIFTNEAWSSLIRTVHSVLNGSPAHLLTEIILVDDCSTREELKGKLDYYLETRLPGKVRLIRLSERSGLIRARLAGAKAAVGDVLVFLDAHCEVIVNWLEPLLQRIKEKRTAVLVPIIDVIDDKTFEYMYSKTASDFFQVGGFSWSGHFTWITIPEQEQVRRGSSVAPTRSATMAGGLFAMERNYFWQIGSYDEQMDVWGGENLEMSFRVWQCGGTLETIPCSRVGHIFRSFHPYKFPGGKDTHGINTARLVEVWMDEYKEIFYMYRPDLKGRDVGDLSARRALRKKLQCKSFKWYLDNVCPGIFVPTENVHGFGQVSTQHKCLDNLQQGGNDEQYELGVYDCHSTVTASQFFSLSVSGELRRENMCAEVQNPTASPVRVIMFKCHGQQGNQEGKQIMNVQTGLCLDGFDATQSNRVSAAACSGSVWQQWET
ncbi:hypothetical protein L9F63_015891, partial [Diploptera punctata]